MANALDLSGGLVRSPTQVEMQLNFVDRYYSGHGGWARLEGRLVRHLI